MFHFGFLSICSLVLVLPCSYGIEYSNFSSFNRGNYTVRWKFQNETQMFYFKVEVIATGWIGFGISKLLWPKEESLQWNRHSMQDYDVIVGGMFDNNTHYYKVSLKLQGSKLTSSFGSQQLATKGSGQNYVTC